MACAETWSGKLYDAKCFSQHEKDDLAACIPTESSSMFVLQVSDKTYKFDSESNKKVADAYQKSRSGAERAADPDESPSEEGGAMEAEHSEAITATVQGTLVKDEIRVETVEVQ
jgi:biotin carboxyl carrier protein